MPYINTSVNQPISVPYCPRDEAGNLTDIDGNSIAARYYKVDENGVFKKDENDNLIESAPVTYERQDKDGFFLNDQYERLMQADGKYYLLDSENKLTLKESFPACFLQLPNTGKRRRIAAHPACSEL